MVKLSLIIPVSPSSERADLAKLLLSLVKQTYTDFEVLMVSGRTDLPDSYNDLRLKRLTTPHGWGASLSRNFAAEKSRGEIFGFLDDDVILNFDWCEKAVETFDDQSVGACSGAARVDLSRFGVNYLPGSLLWVVGGCYWSSTETIEVVGGAGMNFCVRRDVFALVGGYNEHLGPSGGRPESTASWMIPGAEESELALRVIKRAKRKVMFNPRMGVLHKLRRESVMPRGLIRRSLYVGHNRALVSRIHPDIGQAGNYAVAGALCNDIVHALAGLPQHPKLSWKTLSFISIVCGAFSLGYTMGFLRFRAPVLNPPYRKGLENYATHQ